MMKLQITDVAWIGTSFLDPNSSAFRYNGVYHKAIRPTAQPWMQSDHLDAFLRLCWEKGFIPKTERADITIDGFLTVYRQQTDAFSVFPRYFLPEYAKSAAFLFLDMNLWLLRRGMGLADGHTGNFVATGNMDARFCDIGSIIKIPDNSRRGLAEFIRYFMVPLLIRGKSPGAGDLMRYYLSTGFYFDTLDLFPDIKEKIFVTGPREKMLLYLREMLVSLVFAYRDTTWSAYNLPTEHGLLQAEGSGRVAVFDAILDWLRPKKVIDMGANAGFFSIRAARAGADVLAVEPDESALTRLFFFLKQGHAFPGTVKLMTGGLNDAAFLAGQNADLALALALTHHLYFTQKRPWAGIARDMALLTKANLLTEFMPQGTYGREHQHTYPANYSLDNFREQLLRFFGRVEVIRSGQSDSATAPRTFLLCEDKRERPLGEEYPDFYYGLPPAVSIK